MYLMPSANRLVPMSKNMNLCCTKSTKYLFVVVFLLLATLIGNRGFAQNVRNKVISADFQGVALSEVLKQLSDEHSILFYYSPEWLSSITVTKSFKNETLENVLKDILGPYSIDFAFYGTKKIILLKDPGLLYAPRDLSNLILVGDTTLTITGERATISGKVVSGKTGEPIPSTQILVENISKSTLTDLEGMYSLQLPTGFHQISFQYIGFEPTDFPIKVFGNGTLDIELLEHPIRLEEVVVEGQGSTDVSSTFSGRSQINISVLKKMPSSLGEIDILKSLTMMPGVNSASEGNNGFSVRGGSQDQNLILLEGAPVFNSAHLLGFYSIFNSDAIGGAVLYKGNIPANFGGRSSSVLTITQKEASQEEYSGTGGIGLISSRLNLEGPIIKNKASLLVSGRSTYSNWILKRVNNPEIRNSEAAFYDLSAKLTIKPTEKDKLTISSYYSHDDFQFYSDTSLGWNNLLLSVNYFRVHNKSLLSSININKSKYNYNMIYSDSSFGFNAGYEIDYTDFSYNIAYEFLSHKINSGIQMGYYVMDPGHKEKYSQESQIVPVSLEKDNAIEISPYISDEWAVNSNLSITIGFRYNHYLKIGPYKEYIYDPNRPKSENSIIDSISWKKGKVAYDNGGLEPRLSARYVLNPVSSIKASISRMRQNIHLISNTVSPQPIDVWKLSSNYLRPQFSDMASIGYFRETPDKSYKYSAEAYYKLMHNIVEYKNGAELLNNKFIEADLVQGKGNAYGLELLLEKTKGRLTGWTSYTYARAFSHVDSEFSSERINEGEVYPTNFDKPHTFNLILNYVISRRYSISSNFLYSTGRPVTGPTDWYFVDNVPILNYDKRNQYRMQDYHRLDFAINISTNHKKNKAWEGSWSLSVYNLYGRKNPYSIFFKIENQALKAYKYSIIGTPIPSITYNFNF